MPECPDGYEIREAEGFLPQVRAISPSVPRWDEIRAGLDWALNRNPTDPALSVFLAGNTWCAQIAGPPSLLVIYDVDESACVVTYVGIAAVADSW